MKILILGRKHGLSCGAVRKTVYAKDKPGVDYLCAKTPSYLIDGVAYCKQHGDAIIVKHVLDTIKKGRSI